MNSGQSANLSSKKEESLHEGVIELAYAAGSVARQVAHTKQKEVAHA